MSDYQPADEIIGLIDGGMTPEAVNGKVGKARQEAAETMREACVNARPPRQGPYDEGWNLVLDQWTAAIHALKLPE